MAKKYPSLRNDLQRIANEIAENPFLGTDLGNEIYKIRMAITSKGKGKRGGARIIYFNMFAQIADSNKIVLLLMYDKSEMENISQKEIDNELKNLNNAIRQS